MTDIQRYLKGLMSAKEMHALESAALEDPFLADAIEGYGEKESRGETDTAADLKELRARLKARTELAKKRKLIPLYKRNWLSVAAMVLFIAGSGIWFFYFSNNSHPDKTLITKNTAPEQKAATSDSVTATIKSSSDSTSLAINKNEQSNSRIFPPREHNKAGKSHPDKSLPSMEEQPASQAFAPNNIDKDTVAFPSDSGKNVAAFLKRNKAMQMETKADTVTVVLGYGAKRPDNTVALYKKRLQGKAPGVAITSATDQEAVPVNGMAAFNRYIEANKKVPADSFSIHGAVVVSFIVSEDGALSDYKIEKSLSIKMDNEAIRLIKEGPAWKSLKNKKALVTVTINF